MKHSPRTTNPKKLTLAEMWALYRILKPAGSIRVVSVIERVHPLQIAEAIRILYGSPKVVTSGFMLIDYLYRGLEYNHFDDFLRVTRKA